MSKTPEIPKKDEKSENRTEALVAELFAIDPTLKKFDFEVRRLVAEMYQAKPPYVLDHAFRDHLRGHLIFRATPHTPYMPPVKKQHGVAFWTWRFLPVGIVVAFALMLFVPEFFGGDGTGTPVIVPSPSGGTDIGLESADTMMKDPNIPTDQSIMQRTGLPEGSVSITIPRPGPEISVSVVMPQAGYVAVYTYRNGAPAQPLAVSRLLPPGPADNVHMLVSRPLVEGETIYAELRASNGDMRYEDATDPPIYTPSGTFISTTATVSR